MFSNLAEISMLAALCMTGLTVGAAVALVGGKNRNRTSAIVGTAICIVSMILNHCSFNTIRVILKQWNRKRQYAGSKTASDRKQKTSVAPLLWC